MESFQRKDEETYIENAESPSETESIESNVSKDVVNCVIEPMPSTSSYNRIHEKTERQICKTEDNPKHISWEDDEEREDCKGITKDDSNQEKIVKETPLLDFLREIETSQDKSCRTRNQISSKWNKEGQRLRNNDYLTRVKDHCKTMLISTLKMNLLTMVLVVFIAPRHLLAIYYQSCYLTPGGCDVFFKMFLGISFVQICVTFMFPFIFIRVIDKIC